MQAVEQILDELLGFEGARSALLAGPDGLVIHSRGETAVDAETLAAITPGLIHQSREAGEAMGAGGVRQGVFEFEQGLLVLLSLGGEGFLAIAVRAGSNIGRLLYRLERERGRLRELV